MIAIQIPKGTRVWMQTLDGFWVPAQLDEDGQMEAELVQGAFQGRYGEHQIWLRVDADDVLEQP